MIYALCFVNLMNSINFLQTVFKSVKRWKIAVKNYGLIITDRRTVSCPGRRDSKNCFNAEAEIPSYTRFFSTGELMKFDKILKQNKHVQQTRATILQALERCCAVSPMQCFFYPNNLEKVNCSRCLPVLFYYSEYLYFWFVCFNCNPKLSKRKLAWDFQVFFAY